MLPRLNNASVFTEGFPSPRHLMIPLPQFCPAIQAAKFYVSMIMNSIFTIKPYAINIFVLINEAMATFKMCKGH